MKHLYAKLGYEKLLSSYLSYFSRHRILVILIICMITAFLLYVSKYDLHFRIHQFYPHRSLDYNDGSNDKGYFIKTKGCKMPAFEPFSNSVIRFYHDEAHIHCHNGSNPPLVEADENSIWIRKELLTLYKILPESNFSCCYSEFYRPPSNENSLDDRSKYVDKCVKFVERQNISEEFIRVKCYRGSDEIYTDFFSFVIKDNSSSVNIKSCEKYPNVLMVGLDAVSRLNFYRTMPKTIQILKSLNAIDMNGYNKVGDNTYPNLIPVLTGISEKEIEATCYKTHSTFDNCHFIWDDFKEQGYYTAFAEDASRIGLFNFHKNGFSETPTDYYWQTYNRQAIKEIGHTKKMNCYLCLGPRLSVEVLLSYAKKLASTMWPNSYFGFVWETSLTHDFLNYPIMGDQLYEDFVVNLKKRGLLDSTILIFLSDHGIRWGKIRSTHQGRIEERLPFLFFVLPESFKRKYPTATYNLQRNSKRLTTPFDLHETLLDLTKLDNISEERIQVRIKNSEYMRNRGISMFLPIDGNRTCASAAIDPHWCTCHQSRDLETNTSLAHHVAEVLVDFINELMTDYVQCAKLNLSNIKTLSVGEAKYIDNLTDVDHVVTDYTIVIETVPGHGLFEGTIRSSFTGWNVTGTVSRINLYGRQSSCVDDFHLKLYCYCEHFLPQFSFF